MRYPRTLRAGGTAIAAPATFTGTYTLMADVSEFQPDVVDSVYLAWSKAVAIRALYGDAHDDAAWYGGQRRSLLHTGGVKFLDIYQYLVSGQSGAAQAQAFRGLVGAIQKGEIFAADFEEGQHQMLTDWYNEMLVLYGKGIAPYLWTYSGLDFGQAQGALPVQWLAAYQATEPSSPHTLWQFTSSFSIPGIAGPCDCSVYHGTVDQLAALAYGNVPVPAPSKATPAPKALSTHTESSASVGMLAWQAVSGVNAVATGYRVQLEYYKAGFGWVLATDVVVNGLADTIALSPRTKYRWRVAANTSDHIWTGWIEFLTS
jgi:hypothetical protein